MINWDEQWALHARNFLNGFAHVSLADYGGPAVSFKLAPGPGFGDLSHPTTRIMLELMPKKIQQPVIDIGCGSGVLSIAAKCLGAPEVSGIDIDEEAIRHAKSNSALNGCDCYFGKTLPSIPKNPLILMNMISSEQKLAWREEFANYTLIVSGYPVEEKDPHHYGLITMKKELDGWKGFIIEKGGF